MLKTYLRMVVLVGSLFLASRDAASQEIVHALTGFVSSIDTSQGTMTVFQDNGEKSTFKVMASSKTPIAFDKKVAETTIDATRFDKQGAYVVVFYFGSDDNRTAVALKTLGAGPFSSITGEVANWNGHDRTLSVSDKNGAVHSFRIDAQTVAETYMGVVNGSKFDIDKGDQVRLVSSTKDGTSTVLFIRQK
ncbi:MAG: hypothetical protein WCA10_21890 [Terracidiphilus sp.]